MEICTYLRLSSLFVQRNPVSLPNAGSDPPRNSSALTMKEVEELEMLTQRLMKDMDHPPHAEASTSGLWEDVNFSGGGGWV